MTTSGTMKEDGDDEEEDDDSVDGDDRDADVDEDKYRIFFLGIFLYLQHVAVHLKILESFSGC